MSRTDILRLGVSIGFLLGLLFALVLNLGVRWIGG